MLRLTTISGAVALFFAHSTAQAVYFTPDIHETFDFGRLFSPETLAILQQPPRAAAPIPTIWTDFEARDEKKSLVAHSLSSAELELKENAISDTMMSLETISSAQHSPMMKDITIGTAGIDSAEVAKYLWAATGDERKWFTHALATR